MDSWLLRAVGWGVYPAVVLLVLGIGWRLRQWRRKLPSPVRPGVYPKPTAVQKVLRVGLDTFFFPQLAEIAPAFWLVVIIFHASLLAVFIGHLHLLGGLPGALEGAAGRVAEPAGGTAGVLWALATGCLLGRRLGKRYRSISTAGDYLLLLLLLGVIVSGCLLRAADLELAACQEYFSSLLALRPALPAELAVSPHRWLLASHVLLASLLLTCIPFSKLVHFLLAFITNWLRRS
ncbi:MAG: respiratory nitrate reductase subunit gamma [Syntrophomonadaceae bacterium]|nr:respiratory nitrate reductase subunit gamma [Syntrophomonadaceae bacterium]